MAWWMYQLVIAAFVGFAWIPGDCANYQSDGYEFAFAIPHFYISRLPRVLITTPSWEPVQAILTIPGIGFEFHANVSRYQHASIRIPTSALLYCGTGKHNKTVIVKSSDVVSVHGFDGDGSDGDGFYVFPSSHLGTTYRVVSYLPASIPYPSFFCVSAFDAETTVNIKTNAGHEMIILKPYESFRFDGGDYEDLTGTVVQADRAVSVVSGIATQVPEGICCTDVLLEMLPPEDTWRTSFVLAPFMRRTSGYVYRVLATNISTSLTISNIGSMQIQSNEWYEGYVTGDVMISIISDQPILVVQYMTGYYSESPKHGAPSMVLVPPIQSYGNNITFPVYKMTKYLYTYYINVIINCSLVDGLVFNDSTSMSGWDMLKTSDNTTCAIRGPVDTGVHSVGHSDPLARFVVSVYAVAKGASYAYPAGFMLSSSYIPPDIPSASAKPPPDQTTYDVVSFAQSGDSVNEDTIIVVTEEIISSTQASEAICANPCLNNGTCSSPDTCQCASGYTGSQCQNEKESSRLEVKSCPAFIQEYTDQLSMNVSWADPVFYSTMQLTQNSTHESPFLFTLGTHDVVYHAWDLFENTATCSFTIHVTAACLETSAILDSQNISWPLTIAENQKVNSDQRCDVRTINRGNGLALRVCEFKQDSGSKWLEATYTGCGDVETYDVADLADTPVVEDNVENIADALNNVTQKLDKPTGDDIKNVAETFRNIVDVESDNPKVTVAVVQILDNLLSITEDGPSPKTDDTSYKSDAPHFLDILTAFEKQVRRTTDLGQSQPLLVEPNIAITTITVQPQGKNNMASLSFAVRRNRNDDDNNDFREEDVKTKEHIPEDETRVSISIPASIFDNATRNATVGVTFFVQQNDILFPTNSTNYTHIVGTDIISAIVVGIPNAVNLREPVALQFTTPFTGSNPTCVSWNFGISDWSKEGCRLVNDNRIDNTNQNRVTCHCNHLTNFAVLVDFSYENTYVILDVVSKIGCGLSMTALLVTVVIFLAFRRLRIGAQATPRTLLIQLCMALFLLYSVFLVGIDQNSNRNGCIFVAALLQYLTLASLMWMGVEAHNLYLNVVKVFDAQQEHFLLKASILAWGVPVVVTVISLVAAFPDYTHLEYCFVATGPVLHYGLILPVAIVLLHNFITFTMVMYRLCKANLGGNVTSQSQTKKIMQRLQNAFAISILMGLTWVFGLFAIEDAKVVFSAIFCICNSFQGVAVFVLFCLRQEDVQRNLRPYLRSIGCTWVNQKPSSNPASTGGLSSTSQSQSKSHGIYTNADFSLTNLPSPDMITIENPCEDREPAAIEIGVKRQDKSEENTQSVNSETPSTTDKATEPQVSGEEDAMEIEETDDDAVMGAPTD